MKKQKTVLYNWRRFNNVFDNNGLYVRTTEEILLDFMEEYDMKLENDCQERIVKLLKGLKYFDEEFQIEFQECKSTRGVTN